MEFDAAAAAATENGVQVSSTSGAATPPTTHRPSSTTANPSMSTSSNVGHTRTTAASSLSVAQRDYLEHMEGMAELREKMRHRPLRVRCRMYVPSAPRNSIDDNHHHQTTTTVTKVVHLVRHGQGFHNMMADLYHASGRTWTQFVASSDNPYTRVELMDCPLTEVGRRQAEALQGRVRALCDLGVGPQLVVSSPHTRALQTALLAFEPLRGEQVESHGDGHYVVPLVAHEMVREETGVHVCDQRRPVSQIRRDFGPHLVDTTLLPETDELFRSTRRETKEEVGERAYKFLEWLEARPERHVAVSSHSAWLLTLLNGVCECFDDDDNRDENGVPSVTSWFQTGEMRSVEMHFVRADP